MVKVVKSVCCFAILILFFNSCRENPGVVIIEDTQVVELELPYPKFLSEYNFFKQPLSAMEGGDNLVEYEINSPLFSDYSFKKRFIHLPPNTNMKYKSEEVFDFPVGGMIFKFFYYPRDFSSPTTNIRILETRVLIKEEKGWIALPYVWNESGTDAELQVAGSTKNIEWLDDSGKRKSVLYSIPNINDCKSCHDFNGKLEPIGPSARQLNRNKLVSNVEYNQLQYFHDIGWLAQLPKEEHIPRLIPWEDTQYSIANRARAYLEINCGHCHRPEGPAKTSSLHLMASVTNAAALGIGKTPIAAGRGSGGLKYDIVPGQPEKSILYYRMASDEPGIMMPEIGRKTIHEEGLHLIKDWITNLN